MQIRYDRPHPRKVANLERRKQLRKGKTIYTGLPCQACYGTQRYTADNRCILCGEIKAAVALIPAEPRTSFEDKEKCRWCGSHTLYTRDESRYCKACSAEQIEDQIPRLDPILYGK